MRKKIKWALEIVQWGQNLFSTIEKYTFKFCTNTEKKNKKQEQRYKNFQWVKEGVSKAIQTKGI